MANILGLAMKISADATGVQQSLKPAERALISLSEQAEKSALAFRPLARESAAAGEAQERVTKQFADLSKELEAGLDPEETVFCGGGLRVDGRELHRRHLQLPRPRAQGVGGERHPQRRQQCQQQQRDSFGHGLRYC